MKYLKVSDLHKINYEVCGSENGEPILFVHGGPGAGYSERDKRFFDFNKHKVIFFDQRGASKSIPFGSIKENTTQDLVSDINKLLKHLKIDRVILFGGSWGTTLSLVFAIQNPNKIKGLLLRGVFLANKASTEHYLSGGVKEVYPKIWERFENTIPKDLKIPTSKFYLNKMINGTDEEKKYYSYEWAFYEISIFKKNITEKEVDDILKIMPFESLAILEAHYLSNDYFIQENYIINNLNEINDIPVKIIHGKEDIICPVKFAIQLDNKLNNSELFITEGGHSDSEPQTEKKIIEILTHNVW